MDRVQTLKLLLLRPISLLCIGISLCFLTLFFQVARGKSLSDLEERATFLYAQKTGMEERKKCEEAVLTQMERANRVYIEEFLAKRVFLKGEIAKLHVLVYENTHDAAAKERLDFLQNGNNALRLKEQNFERLKGLQEVEVVQAHPVELSRDDLTYLLAQLENTPLGNAVPENNPPYFLIRQFDLLKKPHPSNEETFVLNLSMTKQERVHE